jgi:hypothetical protein
MDGVLKAVGLEHRLLAQRCVSVCVYGAGLGSEGELPFMVQWDHIPSAFAEVTVWFETSSLPDHLRPMLELLFEVIFELPVRQDDGTLWTQEEVRSPQRADLT